VCDEGFLDGSQPFFALSSFVMSDVTHILSAIEAGNPQAAEQLLPLVYEELRKLAAQRLAQEKPGQTLQATALVHEAYLRLVDVDKVQHWNSRGHFFAAAAEAMRRILIDRARERLAEKRGGGCQRIPLEHVDLAEETPPEDLLALDEALEQLSRHDPTAGQLVKLRYYAGLSMEQSAASLNIAVATAYRHWTFARAWLHAQVAGRPTASAD
jgi:RNA polymerase sigma factor (TIGR02999 family)